MDALANEDRLRSANLSDLVETVLALGHAVRVVPISGTWVDVNGLADLAAASGY
jgi:hypothetical protein